MEPDEILHELTYTQLTGLGSLIFLAIREDTTLEYQWKEWGFDDLPHEIILKFEVDQETMLQVASTAAIYVLETLTCATT